MCLSMCTNTQYAHTHTVYIHMSARVDRQERRIKESFLCRKFHRDIRYKALAHTPTNSIVTLGTSWICTSAYPHQFHRDIRYLVPNVN